MGKTVVIGIEIDDEETTVGLETLGIVPVVERQDCLFNGGETAWSSENDLRARFDHDAGQFGGGEIRIGHGPGKLTQH